MGKIVAGGTPELGELKIKKTFDILERNANSSMDQISKSCEESENYDFYEISNLQFETQTPINSSKIWNKCQTQFRNANSIDKRNIRNQMRKFRSISSVLVSIGSLVENVLETKSKITSHIGIVEKWLSYFKQMDADDLLTSETLLKMGKDEKFKDHVLELPQKLKQSCQDYRQETVFEE